MNLRSVLMLAAALAACGPRAHIPPVPNPSTIPHVVDSSEAGSKLARALAPVLFIQRDERFELERVVAVLHPSRRVIAYHLLWRDDIHGSWIPFTVPTDQEIVWVGYDSAGAPTEIWANWHGTVLHTPWINRGPVAINVQWGKHGSMPRGLIESDLPGFKKLNDFFAMHYLGIWDIWLGRLTRPGPGCFCHGYHRYREFTKPSALNDRINVIVRTANPDSVLKSVFGRKYSRKRQWPAE